ncbi:MAG TPA: YIP1 family protein [Noviherbaspirillum sp.]|uniref:YIP1 family protein n=1 Tax=Noviherbaspirillum sp. TaxID=1926288 RepID=UPI002D2F680D|nr:YIP1 family protein [Noviherbaspirillum sp.]HYD95985.1 YIP1 family protein [Noviherbaspirillum sp.]
MTTMDYITMLLSDEKNQAGRRLPAVAQTFFFILLPFSIIPPAMLLLAGHFHPGAFLGAAPEASWRELALIVFAAELVTVPLMAWVMHDLSGMLKIEGNFRMTFLIASLSAVPLWVSSLALAVPNVALLLVIGAAGLLVSALLLHRCLRSVYRIRDEEDAQALASTAFSVGGLLWTVLCGAVVVPLAG